jgi:hypothetical protein
MAPAAKIAFRDFFHMHFVRALRHLKNLIMTTGAFYPFLNDMFFMAEQDRLRTFWGEPQIAAADLVRRSRAGNRQNNEE